jgi:iron complex outermembrane receptor protein
MQSMNTTPRFTRSATLVAAMVFSGVLALAQTATPTPAPATDTPNDQVVVLEKFTVKSGFSGSLAAAAEAKQKSQNIVEVIMSEDIGKLPDISIADSLTRLTGLTTQRVNGRSQGISIRGLNGDFSTALLNGREQVSSGLNRSVEFDNYPSELLNSVVVSKTASADMIAQGLAGTVDLQTVRPLDKTGRTVAVSGYYQTTQYGQLTPGAKKDGQRFNLTYVDQFDDGKVGLAIGYAYSSTPWEGKQFQAWGYPQDSAGNYALGGTKSYVRTSNVDRNGVMAVLEFKPNANVHSTFDAYYSKFDEKQLLRGLEIPMAFWSSAVLSPGYTTSGGLITQSTITNVQPIVRNDIVTKNNNVVALGWNLALNEKADWPFIFDVGYSRIKRTERNLETYSGLGFRGTPFGSADTMTVKLTPGQIPVLGHTVDYSNTSLFKLTDPQGWGDTSLMPVTGMQGYLKYFQSKDELAQFKLLTKHELKSYFNDMELGAAYTDRYKRDGERPTGWIYNANGQPTAALPPIIGTTDFSFLGLGRVYAYDPVAAFNNGLYTFLPNPNADVIYNRWNVTEKLTRLYAQFNIDTKWSGVPVKGNVGLQAIRADQSSSGHSATGSGAGLIVVPVSGGATYNDFAPSLNLNFMPTDSTVIRFSLARQIARPRMFDMRAARSFSFNPANASSTSLSNSPWSGDGGNPTLKPWRSDSIDLAFEKYFKDNKGYFSVALFDKKLLDYIYQLGVLTDFTGYPISGSVTPTLHQGTATSPQNGSGGSIRGLEFTLSLPSELLSPAVKGFGMVLGGAYTDSKIKPWGPTGPDSPLNNLSKKVANVTFYYEHKGFSARISEWYRSDYRAYITNFGAPNFKGDVADPNASGFATAQAEKNVSAQVSYAIQSGSLKGLTFFLQGYNLNDSPLITYNNGDPRQVVNYQKYGASYSLGASYKF